MLIRLQDKIKRSEFINFSKLLQKKDKTCSSDDPKLEMINKNGYTFLVQATEKELPVINCYTKWEQAFIIFAGIYTQGHPARAIELFQYIDTIENAASTFTWDNVYVYDCLYRHLIEQFSNRS